MIAFLVISVIWALAFPNLAAWDLRRKEKAMRLELIAEDRQWMSISIPYESARDDEIRGTALLRCLDQQARLQKEILAAQSIPVVGPAMSAAQALFKKS